MKRFSFCIFSALLINTAVLQAIPKGPCDQEYDVCCQEAPPGPFAFVFPFDRELSCPRDFYVYGTFLLMQAKEDGLEYAIIDNNPSNAQFPAFPVTGGNVKDFSNNGHDWDYHPGFRVGFGFYLNHDFWNIGADWTYINVTDTKSSAAHGGSAFIPLWLSPLTIVTQSNVNASSSWKVRYNTLDLKLGKAFHVSRYLVADPFFGIRAAFIDQNYIARYVGMFGEGTTDLNGTNMKADNDFWGIGPRAGFNTEWILADDGLSLFGNLAVSMLFGKFDIHQEAHSAQDDQDTSYTIDDEFFMNVPNFEIRLGMAWGTRFSRQRFYVSLKVAYEFHQWWDQNFMRRFFDSASTISTDTVSRGDLTFNGFTFRLLFDI